MAKKKVRTQKWKELPAHQRQRVLRFLREYADDLAFEIKNGHGSEKWRTETLEEIVSYRAAVSFLRK